MSKLLVALACLVFRLGSAVAAPIDFQLAPGQPSKSFSVLPIGDVTGDGRIEPFGIVAGKDQLFTALSSQSLGLQDLAVLGRPSDMRLADLNGDGCLDVITQGYGKNDASSDTRALLHLNDGTGRFYKDNAFFQKNIRGAGEGVLVADFNGDSFLDVYLPYYTLNCSPISNYPNVCPTSAQHYLMTNDGRGVFKDTAYASGVALPFPAGSQPEGTQAIDINDDGKIDFYSSGRLFINIGNDGFNAPRFQDCNCGLPTAPVHPATELRADEGAKFLDGIMTAC
jgi:hypothetical protein